MLPVVVRAAGRYQSCHFRGLLMIARAHLEAGAVATAPHTTHGARWPGTSSSSTRWALSVSGAWIQLRLAVPKRARAADGA